jgi:hypothetical protein
VKELAAFRQNFFSKQYIRDKNSGRPTRAAQLHVCPIKTFNNIVVFVLLREAFHRDDLAAAQLERRYQT